jgi:hypothetical protein
MTMFLGTAIMIVEVVLPAIPGAYLPGLALTELAAEPIHSGARR